MQIESSITEWTQMQQQVIIVGHSHCPSFAPSEDGDDGCCLHPRSITGIESENNASQRIKWCTGATAEDLLPVIRELISGAQPLAVD
jgi:hypothetical protein